MKKPAFTFSHLIERQHILCILNLDLLRGDDTFQFLQFILQKSYRRKEKNLRSRSLKGALHSKNERKCISISISLEINVKFISIIFILTEQIA